MNEIFNLKWLMRNKECYAVHVHVVIAKVTMHVVFHDNIFDVGVFNTLNRLWCNQWLILNRIQHMTYNYETGWASWVGAWWKKNPQVLHAAKERGEYNKRRITLFMFYLLVFFFIYLIFRRKGVRVGGYIKMIRVG